MSTNAQRTFAPDYAAIYDLLYQDKPYREEVAFVLERSARALGRPVGKIIDLACGTGSHAVHFQQRGLQGHLNDLSPAMLEIARGRLHNSEAFTYGVSPMQALKLDDNQCQTRYDLAVAMYTTLGYVVQSTELTAFFRGLRQVLPVGGVFFSDNWSAHKITRDYAPRREKTVENDKLAIHRLSLVTHLPAQNAFQVQFDFTIRDKRSAAEQQFREEHVLRYFSRAEIESLLLAHGFELVESGPFFEPQATCVEDAWNFYFVARRKE